MLPVVIPPGTTPHAFLALLPPDHARLVPAGTGRASVLVRLDRTPFTLVIDGNRLEVHPVETERADLVLAVDATSVQQFLDDWSGPQRWLPKFSPQGGVAILTDPRLLRRLAMVTGRIELAIPDFEGGRTSMTIAAGPHASRYEDAKPDVVVELSMSAFERLLAGTLAPDEAMADRHVTVKGKMLVAMQFALAVVPFFPPR